MGGLTPANLKQPSFFGNTALLTNAAMAAMNNKAYATERQLLDMKAEVSAQQQGGRQIADSTQQTIQALQNELAVTRALGQAAHQHGQQQVALTQGEQATTARTQRADKREIAKNLPKQALLQRVAKATGIAVTDLNYPARLSKDQKGDIQDMIDDNNIEGLRALMGSPPQGSPPQTPVSLLSPPYAPPLTADLTSAQNILDRRRRDSETRKYTNPLLDEDESDVTSGTSPPFSFELSEEEREVSTDNPVDEDDLQQDIDDAAAKVRQSLQNITVRVNRRREGQIGSQIPSSFSEASTILPTTESDTEEEVVDDDME
eukprot:COSAG05_NODE_51_length_23916_cov_18.924931_14_plen_317_part_00